LCKSLPLDKALIEETIRMVSTDSHCIVKSLGLQDYQPVWSAMQQFTMERDHSTFDEIWLVEHPPVFTQGQAGKSEHLLLPGDIPVVQVDRGGQVTYHGPGQQVVYFLIDLKRKRMGVRQLVSSIEEIIIELLASYQIDAHARADAPGVYVNDKKICSLGLKIKRGCSFHGLALNVDMDTEPFTRINPCGYQGLEIVQVSDYCQPVAIEQLRSRLIEVILTKLNYQTSEKLVMSELESNL
jgi:lipoyl(octanoyl) transferase